jgi:hypothetical protein
MLGNRFLCRALGYGLLALGLSTAANAQSFRVSPASDDPGILNG